MSTPAPIRVLAVLGNASIDGATVQLLRCLERVDRSRFAFSLCFLGGEGELTDSFRKLQMPTHFVGRSSRRDAGAVFRLASVLRRVPHDVLYTIKHTPALWSRAAAGLAGSRRVVTHDHGYPLPVLSGLPRRVDAFQSRRSTLVLANSRATGRLLESRLGVPRERIDVLYNGVAETAPVPGPPILDRRSGARYVGFVGRLAPEKGPLVLLRALPRIFAGDDRVKAVFAGAGPLREPLEKLAGELRVLSRIRFLPPGGDTIALMREFDLLVAPSVYESFGLVLVEAAVAGIPVVTTNVGGIPEVMTPLRHGVMLQPGVSLADPSRARDLLGDVAMERGLRRLAAVDPDRLADAVLEFPQRGEARDRFVSGAGERARGAFSLEAHVRGFERALSAAAAAP